MIEKIIASDIVVADFDFVYGLLPADTVIYDASWKIDIQPKDSPRIKLLLELCRDPLFMESMSMKINNQGHEGCLEIYTSEFQYMIQYFNGMGYCESIRKEGRLEVLLIEDDKDINSKYNDFIRYNEPVPLIACPSEHFVLLHTTFGKSIQSELRNSIIQDSNFYSRLPKLFLSSNKRSVIDTYNRYLREAWKKEIRVDQSLLNKILLSYSDYKIFNLYKPGLITNISSEGGKFYRYLHYIDAIEAAKYTGSVLIIESFGDGIDDDKMDVLYDEIRNSGIHAYLSTSN